MIKAYISPPYQNELIFGRAFQDYPMSHIIQDTKTKGGI